ncbi:MAG TPA: ATP-binding cassette domain-containing protein [Bordetella sp.]
MIELSHVSKRFQTADGDVDAVSDVSLRIGQGEIFGIVGFSGAGKSTLLRMINLLERPTSGRVVVGGADLLALPPDGLRQARQSIGMIFQHFNLVANRTVEDNVSIALEIARVPQDRRGDIVHESLRTVGLADKARHYPGQLSGGQKQRVAIARAIANRPKVLLCDEPTSALDPQTTGEILKYLKAVNDGAGVTIVIVTHELGVVNRLCHRVAVMEKGEVRDEIDFQDSDRTLSSVLGLAILEERRRDKDYRDVYAFV